MTTKELLARLAAMKKEVEELKKVYARYGNHGGGPAYDPSSLAPREWGTKADGVEQLRKV